MSKIARALALADAHPHDFTLQYPPRREYFQDCFRAKPSRARFDDVERALVYVHVPFCAQRCAYCNFAVDLGADEARRARYVDAIVEGLERFERELPTSARISGIDVGGGTPMLLSQRELTRLLRGLAPLRARCDHPRPLSIETTPEIAANEPEKLHLVRELGVGRVSLGVQSASSELLQAMRRTPRIDAHARAMEVLRRAGFSRVNLDLIFALPGQTEAIWSQDLAHAIALDPDSITTYDCLYRGRGRALTRRALTMPSPSTYGALYEIARDELGRAGFASPYGSVNHSRHPGETGTSAYFEARLLDGAPYVGIGDYASSHRGDRWSFAVRGVDRFIAASRDDADAVSDSYVLAREETMAKYALSSLSFGFLDRARFQRRFGARLEAWFGDELSYACARGWLEDDGRIVSVRRGAFGAMPWVRSLFYSERAVGWLEGVRAAR